MRNLSFALAAAVAASLIAAGAAVSDPVFANQCGVQPQQTVWGEYGWPTLTSILARPGTLLAVSTAGDGHSGDKYAAAVRQRGAATYAFVTAGGRVLDSGRVRCARSHR